MTAKEELIEFILNLTEEEIERVMSVLQNKKGES